MTVSFDPQRHCDGEKCKPASLFSSPAFVEHSRGEAILPLRTMLLLDVDGLCVLL